MGGPAVNWRVIVAATTITTLAFGYGGVTSYAALMAVERDIHPPSLFFTAFALSILCSRLTIVPWADRVGPLRLLYPSLAVAPFAFLALAVADDRLSVILAAALFGLGFGGAYPAFMAWVLGRTDARRRAATFGSTLFAMDTGIGLGSLTLGYLIEWRGYTTAFVAAFALGLLGLPVFLSAKRLLERGV